jgi:uncharacterized protein
MTPELDQPVSADITSTAEPLPQPESAVQHRAMEPVSASERIDVIDILRGLALFGILAANMRGFNAPDNVYGGYGINRLFPANFEWVAQAFELTVFQGKFITLFSFLFGLGFAVQMTRAQERGRSVSFYPRRLAILLGMGLIHALLIWFGDILFTYAAIGFLLFLFRNAKQKTIARWTLGLFTVPFLLYTGFFIASFWGIKPPGGPGNPAEFQRNLQHAISVFRDGSFVAATQLRWRFFVSEYAGIGSFFLTVFILPRFLAGLWVWRSGLLKNPEPHLPTIKKIAIAGLIIGLVCDVITLGIRFIVKPPDNTFTVASYVNIMVRDISLPAVAAFYACSVFLLVRNPVWKARLTPFGAVGRMALSNYLLESIVLTWFFRLTHLYGTVGPAMDYVYTIALFSIQVPLSVWWLKHYQFGPVEWVWRSLTYGKLQPMRRSNPAMSVMAAEAAGA